MHIASREPVIYSANIVLSKFFLEHNGYICLGVIYHNYANMSVHYAETS